MENTNQIKPTAKETIAKFNIDMTRKTPIAVTFYHIGTQKITSGEYHGCSMVAGMEFIQALAGQKDEPQHCGNICPTSQHSLDGVSMDKIIALLKNEGVHPSCMLADSLDNANRGNPATFHISSTNIGRCYNNYRKVVVNYDANMEHHPASNGGKVNPQKIKTVEGITVATFDYNVDSGD